MATLGRTSVGSTARTGWGGYTVLAGPFVADENGTITAVKLYLAGAGVDGVFRGVVFEGVDATTLISTGAEVVVTGAQFPDVVSSSVASGSIVAGHSYWIGMELGPVGGAGFYYDVGSSGDSRYQTNTYPTAPADMSSATDFTDQYTAYIDYTPAASGPPVNTVAPAVTGTATVGQTLSCSTGTWTDGTPAFTYQWQRDVGGDLNFVNIASATSSTYVLVDADDGNKVRCRVTDTDEIGATTASSNAAGAVIEPKPTNSVAPVASGAPYIDATVSASTGTWTSQGGTVHTYQYQWQDSADGSTGWGDITGKTSSTYVVEAGEDTKFLRCNVKATNSGGQSVAATATNVLGPVSAAPAAAPAQKSVATTAVAPYYYGY